MALLPRTSNNPVNPTPQTSVNPISPYHQTRHRIMACSGKALAASCVAQHGAPVRRGLARARMGHLQAKWACLAPTASSRIWNIRPASTAHALRPHSHSDDSGEEEHHSKQIALLAMVPIGLMSLKWAVSIGPAALFVPAVLLAVPIAGTGLRQLLAEGLTMFVTWFTWINHHQAHHSQARVAEPVRVRHTAPPHMLEPQHTAAHPQPHHASQEHLHHYPAAAHMSHNPYSNHNGGPAGHPPSPNKALPVHTSFPSNGSSPPHGPTTWSRQQQQLPPHSPKQPVGVAHMPCHSPSAHGHANMTHSAAHMLGNTIHTQAAQGASRHAPPHHQLSPSPSKPALRSRSASPEPPVMAAGPAHMHAAAATAATPVHHPAPVQEVLDADSMDWPVSDPQPADPVHSHSHQHGARNTHVTHATGQGSHTSFNSNVSAHSVLALQQQQQQYWQHSYPMACANAPYGAHGHGQMQAGRHVAPGQAGWHAFGY